MLVVTPFPDGESWHVSGNLPNWQKWVKTVETGFPEYHLVVFICTRLRFPLMTFRCSKSHCALSRLQVEWGSFAYSLRPTREKQTLFYFTHNSL